MGLMQAFPRLFELSAGGAAEHKRDTAHMQLDAKHWFQMPDPD